MLNLFWSAAVWCLEKECEFDVFVIAQHLDGDVVIKALGQGFRAV